AKEYGIDRPYALQLAGSEKLPLFERAVKDGIKPKLAAFTILSTITELRRDGVETKKIPDTAILATLQAVEKGQAAKEAIPDLFRSIAAGCTFEESLKKLAPSVSRGELETIVRKILADRAEFIAQKGKAALGPLMGVVMAEVRGSVDGKLVSEVLRTELDTVLGGK
ncbi:MAG: GatB/YqeY domain-containing protein, partial [Methanoregula sp.]|nr:GatB/YqeY domain-containing protein [Methanoregula sp.]